MSDSPLNDTGLIATLEQSYRQTRNAQHRLVVRLREVEAESEKLRQEIAALENSAKQTQSAIHSLLAAMRTESSPGTGASGNLGQISIEDEFDMEMGSMGVSYDPPQEQSNPYVPPRRRHADQRPRESTLPFEDGPRNVPPVSQNIEPISQRFADRTITQACTLLLRETGKALHVNELYNSLVAGGFEFKGNNPTISIAVSLNRNRRFRKVAPGTFDLVMRDASQAAS